MRRQMTTAVFPGLFAIREESCASALGTEPPAREESMLLLLANDSLCSASPRPRVHYEESCWFDRPADNLRNIPVISRVPDALLSLVLSPTGDRQFGIALMPLAQLAMGSSVCQPPAGLYTLLLPPTQRRKIRHTTECVSAAKH